MIIRGVRCLLALSIALSLALPTLAESQEPPTRDAPSGEPEMAPPPDGGGQRVTILPQPLGPGETAAAACGAPLGVGWSCEEPDDGSADDGSVTTSSAARAVHARQKGPRVRATRTSTYSFYRSDTLHYGIGGTEVGAFQHGRSLNFNGRQGQVAQSGNVLSGPALRYDFREVIFRGTGHGTVADSFRDIVPSAGFSRTYVRQPDHFPYHHSDKYHLHFGVHFRAEGVNNPSSPDGTFTAAQTSTPYYYCGSGLCYFP